MYKIYANKVCIHNGLSQDPTIKAAEATLTEEDNRSGSLEFLLPPGNVGYNVINLMTTDIVVTRTDRIGGPETSIWMGRATRCDADFYNRKSYYCEGALSFLVDTIQDKRTFEGTIRDFLQNVLDSHNSKVNQNRRINLGTIQISSDITIKADIDYSTTLDAINTCLIEKLGGHVQVETPTNYASSPFESLPSLCYYSDWKSSTAQSIDFGKNLLDMTRNFDVTDVATAILPRGASSTDENGVESYVDISSVNNGSKILINDDLRGQYGYIEKVVDFSDIEEPQALLEAAQLYFSSSQFDDVSIELSAFDMSYLRFGDQTDVEYSPFKVLDKVHCTSKPHGLDRDFPITKIVTDLLDPAGGSITLNSSKVTNISSMRGATIYEGSIVNNIYNDGNSVAITVNPVAGDSPIFLAGGPYGDPKRDPWNVLGWFLNPNSPYPHFYQHYDKIKYSYNFATTSGAMAATGFTLGSYFILFSNGWMTDLIKMPDRLTNDTSSTPPPSYESTTVGNILIYGTHSDYNGSVYTNISIRVGVYYNGALFNMDGSYGYTPEKNRVPMHNISTGSTSSNQGSPNSVSSGAHKTLAIMFPAELKKIGEEFVKEVQNPNNNGYKRWTVIGEKRLPPSSITNVEKMSSAGGYKHNAGALKYVIASNGVGISPWDVPYVGMSKQWGDVSKENEWQFAVDENGLAGSSDSKPKTVYNFQRNDDGLKYGSVGYRSVGAYHDNADTTSYSSLSGAWIDAVNGGLSSGIASEGIAKFFYNANNEQNESEKDLCFIRKNLKIFSSSNDLEGDFKKLSVLDIFPSTELNRIRFWDSSGEHIAMVVL